jgi:hypothetical protein
MPPKRTPASRRHLSHPSSTVGIRGRATGGRDPAGPFQRRTDTNLAWPAGGAHRTSSGPGVRGPGLYAQRRPTTTPGAALQRPVQGTGERAQVLPPGHQRQEHGGHGRPPEAAHRHHRDNPGGATLTRPPAKTAASLTSHTSDEDGSDYSNLTGHTSNVNGTNNSSPGTISRTSSHYRGSPCVPAQSSQQIRPLSETKRSGGSDVATVK